MVRTTASLVCTTDVHIVHDAISVENGRTLGHESVGVVSAVGSDVHGLAVGDRVAVAAVTPCGRCEDCQRGAPGQCGGMLGAYRFTAQMDGNMAEYFLVNEPKYNLAPIPDAVTDEQAVYAADMLSTGFAAAVDADLPLGGTAAVFGLGAVGLSAGIGLRPLGAGLLIGVESDPLRAGPGSAVRLRPGRRPHCQPAQELLGVLAAQLRQVGELRVRLGEPDQQPAQRVAGVPDGLRPVQVRLQPQAQVALDDGGDRRRSRNGHQPSRPVPGAATDVQRRLRHLAVVEQQQVRAVQPGQHPAPVLLDRRRRWTSLVRAAVERP